MSKLVKGEGTNCAGPECRKTATGKSICCSSRCTRAAWNKRFPLRACFNALKGNGKRRGKPVEISFEDFCKWAIETDYINKRGRTKTGWTIDRKDPTKGYSVGNIQPLTNTQNVKKQAYIDRNWDGQQMSFLTISKPVENNDDYDWSNPAPLPWAM